MPLRFLRQEGGASSAAGEPPPLSLSSSWDGLHVLFQQIESNARLMAAVRGLRRDYLGDYEAWQKQNFQINKVFCKGLTRPCFLPT